MRSILPAFVVLCGTLGAACQRSQPIDVGPWPQFRGPGGSGVSSSEPLPATWSEDGSNIAWRAEIGGEGNSSPIVSGGRVFLTTARVADLEAERFVVALDFDSGQVLWETSIGKSPAGNKHRLNTYAAPTPAADGRSVFVSFGDTLACLDFDGRIRWRKEIDPLYHEFVHYGAASSPVLTERAVVLAQDKEIPEKPSGWLAAFDKETGDELWKTSWERSCCSYTTPLVRRRGAFEEIVFSRAGGVNSYDAATGERLWFQPLDINQPVASPLMEDDLLVVFSGAHNVRYGAVMRLSGEGADTQVDILWETNQMIPQTVSPVLYQGQLYVLVNKGFMAAYEIETGRVVWRRRLGAGGGYHSSLAAGDGKIYVANRGGFVEVLAAGEAFQKLASNSLERGATASPAIAEDSLLIRTASALYRIAEQGDPSGA